MLGCVDVISDVVDEFPSHPLPYELEEIFYLFQTHKAEDDLAMV